VSILIFAVTKKSDEIAILQGALKRGQHKRINSGANAQPKTITGKAQFCQVKACGCTDFIGCRDREQQKGKRERKKFT